MKPITLGLPARSSKRLSKAFRPKYNLKDKHMKIHREIQQSKLDDMIAENDEFQDLVVYKRKKDRMSFKQFLDKNHCWPFFKNQLD